MDPLNEDVLERNLRAALHAADDAPSAADVDRECALFLRRLRPATTRPTPWLPIGAAAALMVALSLWVVLDRAGTAGGPAGQADAPRRAQIDTWIGRLGDEQAREREGAEKGLLSVGLDLGFAMELLQKEEGLPDPDARARRARVFGALRDMLLTNLSHADSNEFDWSQAMIRTSYDVRDLVRDTPQDPPRLPAFTGESLAVTIKDRIRPEYWEKENDAHLLFNEGIFVVQCAPEVQILVGDFLRGLRVDPASGKPSRADVERCIALLGHVRHEERDRAETRLRGMGQDYVHALGELSRAKSSADPEVRARAAGVYDRLWMSAGPFGAHHAHRRNAILRLRAECKNGIQGVPVDRIRKAFEPCVASSILVYPSVKLAGLPAEAEDALSVGEGLVNLAGQRAFIHPHLLGPHGTTLLFAIPGDKSGPACVAVRFAQ